MESSLAPGFSAGVLLSLAGFAKRAGREATSVVYIRNETANSPFPGGSLSVVPQGRYLRRSDVAIGEMQYFYVENYMQLSGYPGGLIGLDLEASEECKPLARPHDPCFRSG
jgi:hypothetical protein